MPSMRRSAWGKVHWPVRLVRKARSAIDLEEIVDDGTPQVEIAQQHRALGQVRLRQRQLTAEKVLPSAGEGLVTTQVCRGCRFCR